jgi:hypothetical protein
MLEMVIKVNINASSTTDMCETCTLKIEIDEDNLKSQSRDDSTISFQIPMGLRL